MTKFLFGGTVMHLAVKTHMLVIKYFRRGGVKKRKEMMIKNMSLYSVDCFRPFHTAPRPSHADYYWPIVTDSEGIIWPWLLCSPVLRDQPVIHYTSTKQLLLSQKLSTLIRMILSTHSNCIIKVIISTGVM